MSESAVFYEGRSYDTIDPKGRALLFVYIISRKLIPEFMNDLAKKLYITVQTCLCQMWNPVPPCGTG